MTSTANVSRSGAPGRVSVVIAAYNMAQYLPGAIDSVLAQTHPAFEIHVVDDGSTDDTQDSLRRFRDCQTVFLHSQTNAGQAVAKNRGIRASRGDFIAFLDADDLWTPSKLEAQLQAFDQHPDVGVVYTDRSIIDEHGAVVEQSDRPDYYSGWIAGRLLIDNFINFGTCLVRRECFETVGLFDESLAMGIDYDLWLRVSARYPFFFLDQATLLYREWPGQMSRNWKRRMSCAIRIMNGFLAANPGLVPRRTVDEAWAHTYVTRGVCAARVEGDTMAAARDFFRALRYSPAYLPAWRALAKLGLGRYR